MPISADQAILANIVRSVQGEVDDPLSALIDEYFAKRKLPKYRDKRLKSIVLDIEERPRPPGRLSPSSICGCPREAAFKFVGAKGQKRIDAKTEMIFEDGHWRHHKWQTIFKDMERVLGRHRFQLIFIEENVRIDEMFIAGALDAEVRIKIGNKWRRFVIDIKGANKQAFEKYFREHQPPPAYIKQLVSYCKARKRKYGILLFDCKDNNEFWCYMVEANQSAWGEIRLWCKDVIKHLDRKKLPPKSPDCKGGNFLYNRCPYRSLCFGKKSDRQVEREVFVDFPGVKKQWEISIGEQ